MLRVGDAVILRKATGDYRLDDLQNVPGIVLDVIQMEDGYWMIEVLMDNEINWFDELELKLVETLENGKDA